MALTLGGRSLSIWLLGVGLLFKQLILDFVRETKRLGGILWDVDISFSSTSNVLFTLE